MLLNFVANHKQCISILQRFDNVKGATFAPQFTGYQGETRSRYNPLMNIYLSLIMIKLLSMLLGLQNRFGRGSRKKSSSATPPSQNRCYQPTRDSRKNCRSRYIRNSGYFRQNTFFHFLHPSLCSWRKVNFSTVKDVIKSRKIFNQHIKSRLTFPHFVSNFYLLKGFPTGQKCSFYSTGDIPRDLDQCNIWISGWNFQRYFRRVWKLGYRTRNPLTSIN